MWEKLYHQLPNQAELNQVIEAISEQLIDDITQQVERIKKDK